MSFRKFARRLIEASTSYLDNIYIQLVILVISVSSCAFYIAGTYTSVMSPEARFAYDLAYPPLEIFYFVVFFLDYILSLIAATNTVKYIFSFMGISDFLSLLPIVNVIFFTHKTRFATRVVYFIGFLRFFRLLKLFKLMTFREALWTNIQPYNSSISLHITQTSFKVASLMVSILVYIFAATGFVCLLSEIDKYSFSEPLILW